MNIDLIAKLKKEDEFYNNFHEGDQYRKFAGKSLIFYAISNHDLETRYEISNFLLDKGVACTDMDSEKSSVLHVLLAQRKHDLEKTIKLCSRLIKAGADINALDNNNRAAIQYIINMNYSDDELKPLYDIWFSQEFIELKVRNSTGFSPIELAEKLPFRTAILERMREYVR